MIMMIHVKPLVIKLVTVSCADHHIANVYNNQLLQRGKELSCIEIVKFAFVWKFSPNNIESFRNHSKQRCASPVYNDDLLHTLTANHKFPKEFLRAVFSCGLVSQYRSEDCVHRTWSKP